MGEDASLTEFASASGTDADSADWATTTYAWSEEGAACAACGEVVPRRWQQDGTLVCPACKEWDGE